MSVSYLFFVFRIVNKTSTEANRFWLNCILIQGIDQLHSTNSLTGALQVYRGWNKQPYNCSKQSVCFTSLYKRGHLVHFPMALIQSISVVHIDPSQNNRPCVHSGSLIWKGLSPVPHTSSFLFRFAVFLIGFRLHRISTSKRREQ